jgi:hypothetical protein
MQHEARWRLAADENFCYRVTVHIAISLHPARPTTGSITQQASLRAPSLARTATGAPDMPALINTKLSIIRISRISRFPPQREFAKFCDQRLRQRVGGFGSLCSYLPVMI